jgi:hypothetical protein
MQQLRSYMTAIEQQTLFEEEARRPSSVATYLAVYALIARGFSQRQPALIRRAKGLLVKLSARQDIYLEKAVCALLLGQTEEASTAIDQSAEEDQIAFIRQNSEGAPDLLPGLCLYSERWMQEEVYPHFRDLMSQTVSLKDYFADEQVQAYLEELPNTSTMSSEWTSPVGDRLTPIPPIDRQTSSREPEDIPAYSAKLSSYTPESPNRFQRSAIPVIDRPTNLNGSSDSLIAQKTNRSGNIPPAQSSTKNFNQAVKDIKRPSHTQTDKANSAQPKRKFNVGRLVTVIVIAIALLAGSIWLVVWAVRALSGTSRPESITLEKPITTLVQTIKESNSVPVAQPGPLDKVTATKLVETWQATKSKALGKAYEENLLAEILTEPALSDWQKRAQELKTSNSYLQYEIKSTEVDSVTADGDSKAKVVAKISESRNYFFNGELDSNSSTDDANYMVEYDLIKKDDKWLIREMLVL